MKIRIAPRFNFETPSVTILSDYRLEEQGSIDSFYLYVIARFSHACIISNDSAATLGFRCIVLRHRAVFYPLTLTLVSYAYEYN
jgi:hypothetical protein